MPEKSTLLALSGAVIGGLIGYLLSGWLSRQGYYTVALPGAFMGFGTLLGRFRSWIPSVVLGILGLVWGYFTEWRLFPFVADKSLGYFVGHIGLLKTVTHVMVLLGAFAAFWFPFRSRLVSRD